MCTPSTPVREQYISVRGEELVLYSITCTVLYCTVLYCDYGTTPSKSGTICRSKGRSESTRVQTPPLVIDGLAARSAARRAAPTPSCGRQPDPKHWVVSTACRPTSKDEANVVGSLREPGLTSYVEIISNHIRLQIKLESPS